ncbi:uncharacterized protein LOC124447767 [Xenia sp. Carnegie-2017]|uniref:uncharacterized protein LOC124447767 n=1 Tax=Xenia sp. Carnegie-2017 TaxID=2897299 RepID=UPI001F04F97C|nr:uncharacterized protein LOC124447767 [Xenia sp. Carnegie-2017]
MVGNGFSQRLEVIVHKEYLKPRVVFVNRNICIDKRIENQSEVILPNQYRKFIGGFREGSVTDNARRLPEALQHEVKDVLKNVGSWDVMYLNGGKQLHGDFKGCPCITVDRKITERLVFSHERSCIIGFFSALFGQTPSVKVTLHERENTGYRTKIQIPHDALFQFHECGVNNDVSILANDINKIELSI